MKEKSLMRKLEAKKNSRPWELGLKTNYINLRLRFCFREIFQIKVIGSMHGSRKDSSTFLRQDESR